MEIRPIGSDEIPAFLESMAGPFAFDLPDDEDDRTAAIDRFTSTFEPDRSRCAFDDGQMVGTLGAFSLDLTVPGGATSCAGTTMVTVQTSHRRRGILRRLMSAHLDEAIERGDAIAGLWASDSAIYRRFGFGVATVRADLEFDRSHVSFGRLAPKAAPLRSIDAEEAVDILPEVYEQVLRRTPGMYRRSPQWWTNRRFRDTPDRRDGAGRLRFVVTEQEGTPSGYAMFRIKAGWADDHGAHEVRVVELFGTDGPSWAALWQHVLSHDLAKKIVANDRSIDDPIHDLLAGPRRARTVMGDGLWIRPLDVPAALESRRYPVDGAITIAVHDPMDLTAGTYRLEVEDGSAVCRRSQAEPDLELDVEDLGAAFLGRSRLAGLARLGRVTGTPAAAARADLVFGWDRAPWCPEVF